MSKQSVRLEQPVMEGRIMSPQASALSPTIKPGAGTRSRGMSGMRWVLQNSVWLWLVGLVIIFGSLNGFFFSVANLQNVMIQATVLGLLALAVSLPLLIAEIDLSIASNMGFSSVVGAMLVSTGHWPWWLGMQISRISSL